ncbi:adiponectin-like [Mercenaria mercenaria]|uniref:adiponectin-like n=1 Tax=Mercenaria mercenaria TaxID=6596 RepID=UPI00234FA4B6|nr:adiponectin-like [Mercenaria mercenaria]
MEYVVLILTVFCSSKVYSFPIDAIPLSNGQENSTNTTKDEMKTLKDQVAALSQIVNDIEKKQDRLLAYLDQSDVISQNTEVPNSIVVGFTVALQNHIFDLPLRSTVIYDEVFYNAGNGYDASTGIFTAPHSGLYLFYINVEPVDETIPASVAILVNGSYRVAAVAERYDKNNDSTGSNVLAENIQEGDRVWVETYLNDNQNLFEGFTTFSGVLIEST